MATFPSIEPSYSVTKISRPKLRTIKFADGYEKRFTFGLAQNQNPKVYNLNWNDITELQADVIESFLNGRIVDGASFTYTPPNEGFSKTGTYDVGTINSVTNIVTVTIANHGLVVGDVVNMAFETGSAVVSFNGNFTVLTTPTINTFTLRIISSTVFTIVGDDCTVVKSGAKQFKCEEWTKTMKYSNLADIKATFTQVFEP
jgi:phage-related protein